MNRQAACVVAVSLVACNGAPEAPVEGSHALATSLVTASPAVPEFPESCVSSTPTGNGLPFRMAKGLSAAGYGLNTNDDGVQNYGEVAVDCGGAGATACTDVALDVQINTDVLLDPKRYAGYHIHLATGTLNGHIFQLTYPEPKQAGLSRSNAGIVTQWPTHMGHPHGPNEPPYVMNDLGFGQELGATAIAVQGVSGGHPYVTSAQLAVLASRYLRQRGLDTIVVAGGSYGGASSLVAAAAYPEHFDGAVSFHAPYDGRAFLAMSELGGLRSAAGGLPVVHPLHYSARDALEMATAQAGVSVDSMDLTRLGNAIVPTIVLLGEVDTVWYPGWRVAQDELRMAAEGIDWVRIKNIPEAGHGGIETEAAAYAAIEELFTMIDERRESGLVNEPAHCARPRSRAKDYDAVLRARPRLLASPAMEELWSDVTLIEPGHTNSATFTAGNILYTGSLQGFVTRRSWQKGSFVTEWSVPVGRQVESVELAGDRLIVGSKRGITVIEAKSGTIVRESTDLGSVSDVEVGDILPAVPGLEIAARVDQDILHVESLSSGERLSHTVIGTGGAMRFVSYGGAPRLFAPVARGHVVGFEFVKSDAGEWLPEATWLSAYLQHEVSAIALLTTADGSKRLVAGGELHDKLHVLGEQGEIESSMTLPIGSVDAIADLGPARLLVGGWGGIAAVDVSVGAAQIWSTTRGSHVAAIDVDQDGRPEVLTFERSSGHAPAITLHDAHGQTLWETRGRDTSPAMDVSFIDNSGQWELSVMNHGWSVDRFDLLSGAPLGSTGSLRPSFAVMPPRRLVRDATAAVPRYEAFLHHGDVLGEGPGAIRVGTRCGAWVASHSIDDEQLTLLASTDRVFQNCAWDESNKQIPSGTPGLISERIGGSLANPASQPTGALRFVDVTEPSSHAVMTTGGGQIALYAVAGGNWNTYPVPVATVDLAGTQTTLAVGKGNNGAILSVGSWLRNAQNHSLHLLEAATLKPLAAIDAGFVTSTELLDVNGDGIDEVLAGTHDGMLRVYDQELKLLAEWSAGDLNLGENGALLGAVTSKGPVVAFAVNGGFRVLRIQL